MTKYLSVTIIYSDTHMTLTTIKGAHGLHPQYGDNLNNQPLHYLVKQTRILSANEFGSYSAPKPTIVFSYLVSLFTSKRFHISAKASLIEYQNPLGRFLKKNKLSRKNKGIGAQPQQISNFERVKRLHGASIL